MKHFCSFSEAIREGSKLRPQAFGVLRLHGKTCAIGAGLEAMGAEVGEMSLVAGSAPAVDAFPYLSNVTVMCPAQGERCADHARSLFNVIMDLNDKHNWTREAIAEWLETEEEKIGFVLVIESESSSKSLQRSVPSV